LLQSGDLPRGTWRERTLNDISFDNALLADDVRLTLLAQKLHEAWKTPVTIENVPGAGGSVGAERVAKSASDVALLGGQRRNDYQPSL
jgi:hypothetical protein